MVGGYYTHAAALVVAQDPRVKPLFAAIPLGKIVPVGFVWRKDTKPGCDDGRTRSMKYGYARVSTEELGLG
jgi:hypothetical protein